MSLVLNQSEHTTGMCTLDRIQALETQLIRTQRHVRWLVAGMSVAISVSALSWIGVPAATEVHAQLDPRVVRARAFILEDDNGANRGVFAVNADGPGLALYDPNGKPRATLGVSLDGPSLTLSDANDTPRAALHVVADGPGLTLFDPNGRPRAQIDTTSTGPRLALSDVNGTARAAVGVTADGPVLVLADTIDKPRATLAVPPAGPASLLLFAPDGTVSWRTP